MKAHTLHPHREGVTACGLNLGGSDRSRKGAPKYKPPFIVALKDFSSAHERCQNCKNELDQLGDISAIVSADPLEESATLT